MSSHVVFRKLNLGLLASASRHAFILFYLPDTKNFPNTNMLEFDTFMHFVTLLGFTGSKVSNYLKSYFTSTIIVLSKAYSFYSDLLTFLSRVTFYEQSTLQMPRDWCFCLFYCFIFWLIFMIYIFQAQNHWIIRVSLLLCLTFVGICTSCSCRDCSSGIS